LKIFGSKLRRYFNSPSFSGGY